MERLTTSEETQELLEGGAESNKWYWRYQDSKWSGLIPVGHKSFERMGEDVTPNFIEDGVSCYDNPYQLLEYLKDEDNNIDTTDIILFVGTHNGIGKDEEDIVNIDSETDVKYSMSLRDFYEFCKGARDYWYNDSYSMAELAECLD